MTTSPVTAPALSWRRVTCGSAAPVAQLPAPLTAAPAAQLPHSLVAASSTTVSAAPGTPA